jgi:hypothetical protein
VVEGEQVAVGGGSAERKAEELAAAGDRTAALWAAGAAGERRVADELASLREAWTVLHDRLLRPGLSEANLDHVVIGPGGLFLVDAKNWSGNVTAWQGGLYQHLGQAGARTSQSRHAELSKVHGMAMYMAVESGLPTTPVVCLAGPNEAKFGEPQLIRDVWVVPVSKLVAWLETRPPALGREEAAKAVTRAMTSFPSTTTDGDLLAAMGAAALATKRPRRRGAGSSRRTAARGSHQRGAGMQRGTRPRPPLPVRIGRTIGKLFLGFLVLALGLALIPPLLTAAVKQLAPSVAAPAAPPVTAPTTTAPGKKATSKPKAPAPLSPDCANASAAEISKIIGRKVKPIAVSTGCAWGTRLDDASTTLVTIRMSAGHAAYDTQLVTSVKQKRVVFGTAFDAGFQPGTALWVATGQPITKGKNGVTARADTHVLMARTALGISDDRARQLALAIAAAANDTN